MLRIACMIIRCPKKVTNEKVCEVTQVKPWKQTIKICQMKWFGHLIRLPDNTSTKPALKCLRILTGKK